VQVNVHQAKTQFSRLLELVTQGEQVIIARAGQPVAELVPYMRKGLQLGAGVGDPLVDTAALDADQWHKAMPDEEAEAFAAGL
jgi:prevent-host-death family protein